MSPPSLRLGLPRPVAVDADAEGVPMTVGSTSVETVREEWLVEEGWWTNRLLRRRYFELVLADGRDVVVFEDLLCGDWFSQRD